MIDAPLIDIGDAPLLVFGGPYGNLQATRALLAAARGHGIPPSRMLCTGDLVAYCADPGPVVTLVREAGIAVVQGNVEQSLGAGAEDCGCGFVEGSPCDVLSARWYVFAAERLDGETRRWMAGLPGRIDIAIGGFRLAAVHGAPSAINRFVFPATPPGILRAELDRAAAHGVIGGHSGLPFTTRSGGCLWHNAGAIGLPANDGTPRAWYSILRPVPGGLDISIHALDYDHAAAARALRDAGLPEAYAAALETGLWPSDEIMPAADRARRGMPLVPGRRPYRPTRSLARVG